MKKQKTWNLMGLVVGIAVILMGLVFTFTPADHYTTKSTENASFGADFYTLEYEATRAAASNAAIAANNLRELGEKMAVYQGMMFVVAGVLITLCYGKKYFCVEQAEESQANVAAAVQTVEPAVPEAEAAVPSENSAE